MTIPLPPRRVDRHSGFIALAGYQRAALAMPAVALLWMGVWWASLEAAPL